MQAFKCTDLDQPTASIPRYWILLHIKKQSKLRKFDNKNGLNLESPSFYNPIFHLEMRLTHNYKG